MDYERRIKDPHSLASLDQSLMNIDRQHTLEERLGTQQRDLNEYGGAKNAGRAGGIGTAHKEQRVNTATTPFRIHNARTESYSAIQDEAKHSEGNYDQKSLMEDNYQSSFASFNNNAKPIARPTVSKAGAVTRMSEQKT